MPDDNPTYDEQVISAFSAAEIYAKSIINVDSKTTLSYLAVIIEHLKSIDLRYTNLQTQIICGHIFAYIAAMVISINTRIPVKKNNETLDKQIEDIFSAAETYVRRIINVDSNATLSCLAVTKKHLESINLNDCTNPETKTTCENILAYITDVFTDVSNGKMRRIIDESLSTILNAAEQKINTKKINVLEGFKKAISYSCFNLASDEIQNRRDKVIHRIGARIKFLDSSENG